MSFKVEFGTLQEANDYRKMLDEYVCPVDDDRRLKTVAFVEDTPDEIRQEVEAVAAAGRAERQGDGGQASLTDGERDRVDWSRDGANVPKYRAIKGIAIDAGVDDWLAYVDPTLTVDEHREVMKRAASDDQGARMDAERTDEQRAADLVQQHGGGDCDHARGHCEHGDADACEFLRSECGLEEDELAALLDEPDAGDEEIDGAAAGALKRSWQGYKGAISALDELLEDVSDEWEEAQRAAKAINSIRAGHGQDALHFEELEERQARLTDLMRKAAADCVECHADHGAHDHATDEGVREAMQDVVEDGAGTTPVGIAEDSA